MANKKTQIEIPDGGVEANVVENINGKRVAYKAPVIEVEDNDNDEIASGGEHLEDFESTFEAEIQEIPKSRIERLFDDIRVAAHQRKVPDQFYAHIIRQPDLMGVNFNRPCSTDIDLGAFQFTTRDQMEFHSAIQKRNGNSGGIFNVRILTADRKYLTLQQTDYRISDVGLINYFVPDPFVESEKQSVGGGGESALIMEILKEMRAERYEMLQTLREQQTTTKTPSLLEQALERKILREIENPPEARDRGTDVAAEVAKVMTATMSSFFTAPAIMQKMASSMFPEAPKEKEPTFLDQAEQFADSSLGRTLLPAAVGLVDKIGDISTAYAAKKMNLSGEDIETSGGVYNPAETEKDEMQILIENMVAEIESERALDESNEFLQSLQVEYPEHAQTLLDSCKALPFESVVDLLLRRAKKMQPSPFMPFVDLEASQAQGNGQIVWNDRGKKALARLQTLYAFVRTLPDLD